MEEKYCITHSVRLCVLPVALYILRTHTHTRTHTHAVRKSQSAVLSLRHEKEDARRLKAIRKQEQEHNVARKKEERAQHKERCLAGMSKETGGPSVGGGSDEDDDVEWYRQEVGEEPDPGEWAGSGVGVFICCDCNCRHVYNQ